MISLYTPKEHAQLIASRVRAIRLSKGINMKEITERSGVSYSSYRRFERTGEISFVSLLAVAQILGLDLELNSLFKNIEFESLDQIDAVDKKERRR